MIKTKDLEEFIERAIVPIWACEVEFKAEIITRLRAYDELKRGIEKASNLRE